VQYDVNPQGYVKGVLTDPEMKKLLNALKMHCGYDRRSCKFFISAFYVKITVHRKFKYS
jgi:hypothetical protein